MPIVTQSGFAPAEEIAFHPFDVNEGASASAVDFPNDADPALLEGQLAQIDHIRIPFPSFADGRGFGIARRLRDLGYKGRLRAQGHVISDQFRYALDCGFDDVEISADLAARQPEEAWTGSLQTLPTYRQRLAGQTTETKSGGTMSTETKPAEAEPAETKPVTIPDGVFAQEVTAVEHYTDSLFRFRIKRPGSFRFRSGEFVMIGLPSAEKPIYRAYSMASPSWDEELEFFSIKVPDGPLTQHLQKIRVGDTVLMKKKPTGTLVNDALLPGRRLWMLSTGTGIAPFASLVREPETYEKFDQIVLCHTCRLEAELAYGHSVFAQAKDDPLVGENARAQLLHYATTTRETSPRMGRITDLIRSGQLFEDLNVPAFDPDMDRVMICGSMEMIQETKAICEAAGLVEGANNRPATFVIERAFVG